MLARRQGEDPGHHFRPVALKLLTPCGMGLAVGDEVVDSKKVTQVRRRNADEPEGRRGDVAAIAAVVHEASSRHRNLWFPPDGLALSLEGLVTKSWLLKTGASGSLPRSTKERQCSSTSHWETAASVPASESWDGRRPSRSGVDDWISMSGSEIGIRPWTHFQNRDSQVDVCDE